MDRTNLLPIGQFAQARGVSSRLRDRADDRIDTASNNSYRDNILPSGLPTGSLEEEALDYARNLYVSGSAI